MDRVRVPEEYKGQMPPDLQAQVNEGLSDFDLDKGHVTTMDILNKMYADAETWLEVFLERLRLGETQEVAVFALTLLLGALLAYGVLVSFWGGIDKAALRRAAEEEKKGIKTPPRDFTLAQLSTFDGREEPLPGGKGTYTKPIYVGVKRVVYDVTQAIELYGDGGVYRCFVGKEASRALGKNSFDKKELDNPNYADLTGIERDQLEHWEVVFKYHKEYPQVRDTHPCTHVFILSSTLYQF